MFISVVSPSEMLYCNFHISVFSTLHYRMSCLFLAGVYMGTYGAHSRGWDGQYLYPRASLEIIYQSSGLNGLWREFISSYPKMST